MEITEPMQKKLKSTNNIKNISDDVFENNTYNLDLGSNILQETCTADSLDSNHDNEDKNDTEFADTDDETNSTNNDIGDSFMFPPDEDINDMLAEVEIHEKFPSVTERYFTAYYKVNIQRPGDDICIWIHSNRICMISLAPSHLLLEKDKKILKVDFKVSDKLDRASNKVSGKSKHGAQPLQANSNICAITSSNGQIYMIKCCIIGKLVEVNEMLLQNPELLKLPPHKGGYLAIVLPNIRLLDKIKETLLSQDQYKSLISERCSNTENIELHSDQ